MPLSVNHVSLFIYSLIYEVQYIEKALLGIMGNY